MIMMIKIASTKCLCSITKENRTCYREIPIVWWCYPSVFYRVFIKSQYHCNPSLLENHMTQSNAIFCKMFYISPSFDSVHLNMCPSSCSEDVETIFQFSPYTLQHININSLHSFSYPSAKCNEILNRYLVDIFLDVSPKKKIQGSDVRRAWWPGDWFVKA